MFKSVKIVLYEKIGESRRSNNILNEFYAPDNPLEAIVCKNIEENSKTCQILYRWLCSSRHLVNLKVHIYVSKKYTYFPC